MLGLNQRKLEKLKREPFAFFKDAFRNKYRVLSKFKPKKYQAYNKYAIVSAVYNVEKYLDDFFKSIINQRLDFKRNIFIICVDDGSTDNSAQIIKKYQKKYPKNIIYLYKENGGQASARNLGLKYLKENDLNTPWVTFTDPDDFLGRDYFYEVDKFLECNSHMDICTIRSKVINYLENSQYDKHILDSFLFKQDSIKLIKELKNETPSGNTSLFLFDIINKYNIKFPETSEARANFEDVRFAYEYFLNCLDKYAVILTKAIYYLRKRKDSTTAISLEKKEYYLGMPKQLIELCELSKKYRKDVTIFEQNIVLYHTFWHVFKNINCPEKLFFLSNEEKKEYLNLIKKSLEYVDRKSILFFSLIPNFNWFYKVGFLYCFKNEEPFFNVVYIEKYDSKSNQLLLRYYTCKDKDVKKVFIGMKEVEILDEKITKSDLLGNLFVYTKRFWISLPDSHFWNDNLEIFIDQKRAMVGWNNFFDSIKHIVDGVKKDNNLKEELWLFIDREFCADDNAEHLYRYIMKNHPNQKIAFILRKRSKDWTRLKNEGFNLLDFESLKFKKYVKKSTKIISSSADDYFLKYFKNKNFIFLQHGVIKDDLSFWLNSKNIDLFVTSTYPEYYSIISNYNRYKFTRKEVVLTGLPRYDVLKKNNNSNTKNIFLMPTWRQYLVNSNSDFFMKSRYYRNYDSLFKNIKLQKICSKYNYNILFLPHPNMAIFNNYFKLPKYVTLTDRNKGIQYFLQNSDILITDYSSIAFDMAFLEKPIIYYQFDRDEFFLKHSYQKGYFDYNKDAFGPVVFQESELLEQLERLLRNNSKLEDIYKNRINNAFVFKDQCNCERIYNKILEV